MRKLFSVLSSTIQVRGGLLLLLVASVSVIYASDTQVDGIWYDFKGGTELESVDFSAQGYTDSQIVSSYQGTNFAVIFDEGSNSNVPKYYDKGTAIRVYGGGYFIVTSESTITKIVVDFGSSDGSNAISTNAGTFSNGTWIGNSNSVEFTIGGTSGHRRIHKLTVTTFSGDTYTASVTYKGDYHYDYDDEYSGSIVIPETVTFNSTTYSVTSIGNGAFYSCSSLTSVTIPNSVTSIGEEAFQFCSSLKSVTIPNSVTSIGEYAFYGCYSLKSVTIPNSVTSIGGSAFWNCSSLTSVTIPNSVTSIGEAAFKDCSSLTSVTIPNSVTSIGKGAFEGCSSLTSVTIPNSVTSIGKGAFRDCSSLTSVTIPNSVTSIGSSAFYGCSSLPVENNLRYADTYLVEAVDKTLSTYSIKKGTKWIGSSAFEYCSSLTSVTIPNSVTSIGDYAFFGCSSLTKTNYTGDIAGWCNIIFGDYYANPMYYSHNFYINDQEIKDLVIPNSVTSIGDYAFEGCTSLTSVTCEAATPPTVGSDAFYKVSRSIPVYVPCGCVEAYKAASGWSDFTNIQVPLLEYSIEVYVNDTIMGSAKVDYNTFCEGAKISATANDYYHFVQWSDGNTDNPRTLTLTQDTVLTAEFALTIAGQCGDNLYWSYDETAKTISITGSGNMYDFTADTQPWLLFKEQIVEVTTTNTVTSIGTSAFEGCARLAKISLGTGLEEIAANAFAGCTRLYDIYTYATYPPFADESSFANYNVYVYIPCEYQRDYILDVVWGKFKFIECLESEDVTTDGNVTIVPGYNDVTITWPTEDNADTYTIVIKKDGEVFCTLTFNSEGQLLNIAFAPGRDGNRPAQYAEQAGNGYRFTVTGLSEATQYAYSVTTKDAANQTIATYSGEFTTKGGTTTAVKDILQNTTNVQKLLRNGQFIIVRDGVEYNAMGQEM